MKEFVSGSYKQFEQLAEQVSCKGKMKFQQRQLPPNCSVPLTNIWFDKRGNHYIVMVDRGIQSTCPHPLFQELLKKGVLSFQKIDEMVDFFHSLAPFFEEEPRSSKRERLEEVEKLLTGKPFDHERLQQLQTEENTPTIVWPEEISSRLKAKLFGQDEVMELLAEKVVLNQLKKQPQLLSLTFIGPTATGKSETAKVLAEVLTQVYGHEFGYIEISGNEFVGEQAVHRFFGAPPGYIGHGNPTLLDPVRYNPYHVIVINEIEKANGQLLIGLMEAIDKGSLGMADNSPDINLRQCILILTSNLPVDLARYDAASEFERGELCRDLFTEHCKKPEISGKIGNFLVFRPLDGAASADIILKFIQEELDNFGLVLKTIDERLMLDFLKHETKYGARGLRLLVGDTVGRWILKKHYFETTKAMNVTLAGSVQNMEIVLSH